MLTARVDMPTLLVCDSLRVIAEAIAAYVDAQSGVRALGTACRLDELLRLIGIEAPDVVLVEPRGLGLSAVAAVRLVHETEPRTRVLLVADTDDPAQVLPAVRAGGFGWVSASDSLADVEAAVRTVAAGGMWLSPSVLGEQEPGSAVRSAAAGLAADEARALVGALTDRERAVLAHLVGGFDRKALARQLGIADSTARTHVQRVIGKLGARNAIQAAAIGRRAGIPGVTRRG
ncbi:response regulator transcription factor [Kribbella sp. NBC_01245]|uniref:response regulator transcription factor n=1 Tax=Kribbella sp. NBC_01245 TaxID=2903578 RepID=UPI002E2B1AE7|nr:response regulator transcription factor [Kribbella sp. NBC_01245]